MENSKEQKWRYCLVGNIVERHEFGEEKDLRIGSKQFSPGAKVYIAPANWGDGYEKVIVIGCPRKMKGYIEVVTKCDYIENFRLQKVFKPCILKIMDESKYVWWKNTEEDKERINRLIETLDKHCD